MQLLGELLLERSNLKVMVRYVADEANLKLMMNLLRDSSRSIQFEAFHVFKVSYSHNALCHAYYTQHLYDACIQHSQNSSHLTQQNMCTPAPNQKHDICS